MKELGILLALVLAAGAALAQPLAAPAPVLAYRVVAQYPHDPQAFTEGLAYAGGKLYESTGLIGQSSVRIVDPQTGKLLDHTELSEPFFGEGLCWVGKHLVQLTWRSQIGFVYDGALHFVRSFRFKGEGWGLTYDGHTLIESDGSSTLHRWSAEDYAPLGDIAVRDGGQPVERLNELEYADGRIYANVWMTDDIAVIDPASGQVQRWIDLSPLRRRFTPPADWNPRDNVPNGIAWNPQNHHLYVTGKRWPLLFELQLEPAR